MVPNGWKRVPIKEVCHSIIDCVNKTAPVVDYETPYKMIRTSNVRNGRVNTVDVRYVTKETYEQWTRRGAPLKGDVILTREAPVGEVALLENAEGIFLGQRLMMYRVNKKIADNYYLFYSLSSAFCQKQIEDYSNGGTVAHMRVPDCGEILVNLPPLSEQNKIAQILSTWDQAISATEKLLKNSQQQKKALMQQLLTGKKRLLDENGERFLDEWNQVFVSEICHIGRGRVISKTEIEENKGTFPVYSSQTLHNGVMGYLNTYDFDGEVVTWTTDGVNAGTVFYRTGKFNCTNVCGTLTPKKSSIDLKFLAFSLSREAYKYVSHTLANPKLMNGVMGTISLRIPSFKEQQKIAKIISVADKEIETTQKKLDCLKQEKKALMQQLLTGKKRVKVAA